MMNTMVVPKKGKIWNEKSSVSVEKIKDQKREELITWEFSFLMASYACAV